MGYSTVEAFFGWGCSVLFSRVSTPNKLTTGGVYRKIYSYILFFSDNSVSIVSFVTFFYAVTLHEPTSNQLGGFLLGELLLPKYILRFSHILFTWNVT